MIVPFNQSAFTCLPLDKGSHKFHSIDLSAATDRMPILLQKRIISRIFGQKKANAWHWVLTALSFTCKTDKSVKQVRYAVGQPMGAHSSWPAMALTHHFIVRIAAIRAGKTARFSDYFLLGDDLVIANDLVAQAYKELISKLGMPYSKEENSCV